MTLAIRAEVLKAALEDDETRRKMNLAPTWEDVIAVLLAFAKARNLTVVQL